jgi:hypothetical protein
MDGTRVFIDPTILEKVEATRPATLSQTGWVNYLLDVGIAALNRQGNQHDNP